MLSVLKENIGSARVLEKCGFKYEGLLIKGIKKDNRFVDEKMYDLVR